ncbi:MAG: glycosyltransferase family 4 protein [Prevotella sp.]|nr:glycosyltransferase family 4 protein [Prevotella sp.]
MARKLFVFGNIGDLSQLPKGGGGQTSCRRVMQGFQDAGLEIAHVSRHFAEWEGKLLHVIEVLFFGVTDLFKIFFHLRKEDPHHTLFFHMTFSGPLLPYEYIVTKLVRMMGFKSVMYLQGGQFLHYYNKGGKRYRKLFAKVLNMQATVMFEGKEGIDLVRPFTTVPLSYFPSYTFNKDIPATLPKRPTDTIRLLFFGRIDANKNIDVVIRCFEKLCERHDNIWLTIIGGPGNSKAYVSQIDQMIAQSPHHDHIERHGLSPFSFIKEKMQTHHFFIFPTSEPCEGHSNALSEAMSQGLIPIVSDHNFNRSIVGDDHLVVKDLSPSSFAEKVEAILEEGSYEAIASQMLERERALYSYEAVNPRITQELKVL